MGIKYRPRPGMSWSAMRQILENENICDSLKGRVQYFQTNYRKAHDQHGRLSIRVDGEEIVKANYYDSYDGIKPSWCSASFYSSFYDYHNSSIDVCLESSDSLVRLFAIFDKRCGKRRLVKLMSEVENQPEWLQIFLGIRLEAEKITINHT